MNIRMNKTLKYILWFFDHIAAWIIRFKQRNKNICPLGLTSCEGCQYRNECYLHLHENV